MAFLQAYGFDGPIYEADWSRLAALFGHRYTVESPAAWAVSAVPGERAVTISAGRAQGVGIISQTDAAETVTLPTPVGGQWFLIVCARNWNPDPIDEVPERFTYLPGRTTNINAANPTRSPGAWPDTYRQDAGVADHQPIAWVFVKSNTTDLQVFDLRNMPSPAMPTPGTSLQLGYAYAAGPIEVPKSGSFNGILYLDVEVAEPTKVEIVGSAQWSANQNAAGQLELFAGGIVTNQRVTPEGSGYSHNLGVPSARIPVRQSAYVVLPAGVTRVYLRATTDSGSGASRMFQFINLTVWRA